MKKNTNKRQLRTFFRHMQSVLPLTLVPAYIILIVSHLGNFYYLFDLFSHFYLQYCLASIFFLILFLIFRCKRAVLLVLPLILYTGFWSSKTTLKIGQYEGDLNMYFLNALYYSDETQSKIDSIRKYEPKQIAMVELNKGLYNKIKEEFDYKYSYYYDDGVLSFGYFTNEEVLDYQVLNTSKNSEEKYPIGYVKTAKENIYIVHPLPPLNEGNYRVQKLFFQRLNGILDNDIKAGRNFLVVGDFNSSIYSTMFRKYIGDYYYKAIYSWKVDSVLRLPIDYAISNRPREVYGANPVGSDHIPILVK